MKDNNQEKTIKISEKLHSKLIILKAEKKLKNIGEVIESLLKNKKK